MKDLNDYGLSSDDYEAFVTDMDLLEANYFDNISEEEERALLIGYLSLEPDLETPSERYLRSYEIANELSKLRESEHYDTYRLSAEQGVDALGEIFPHAPYDISTMVNSGDMDELFADIVDHGEAAFYAETGSTQGWRDAIRKAEMTGAQTYLHDDMPDVFEDVLGDDMPEVFDKMLANEEFDNYVNSKSLSEWIVNFKKRPNDLTFDDVEVLNRKIILDRDVDGTYENPDEYFDNVYQLDTWEGPMPLDQDGKPVRSLLEDDTYDALGFDYGEYVLQMEDLPQPTTRELSKGLYDVLNSIENGVSNSDYDFDEYD